MTKLVVTILILMVAALAASAGFVYSGIYDVGADVPHGNVVGRLLSTTSRASVQRRAANIDVPELSGDTLRLAGANDFKAMCAGCHGAPGQEAQADRARAEPCASVSFRIGCAHDAGGTVLCH